MLVVVYSWFLFAVNKTKQNLIGFDLYININEEIKCFSNYNLN